MTVKMPKIACVGTRKPSKEMIGYLKILLEATAEKSPGAWILSGGADGIDSISVETALKLGLRCDIYLPLHEIHQPKNMYGRLIPRAIPATTINNCLLMCLFPMEYSPGDLASGHIFIPQRLYDKYYMAEKDIPHNNRHYHWRNEQIAKNANKVYAFHDGSSKGTMSTIKFCKKHKTPVQEIIC